MRALHLKALRDLWLMRGQALAIALVIASGIAMLVMSQATIDSLRSTSTRLYQQYRFSDVWSSLKRAPNSVAERLREIPGVGEAETRIAAGAKVEVPGFDESVVASVLSLPNGGQPQQNRLYLRSGRMLLPDAAGEILVSDAFADAHRLAPGHKLYLTINGRAQWFTIVGIATSPEFLNQVNPSSGLPDYKRFVIVWMPHQALQAAMNMDGAFNQVTLKLAANANERSVIDALDAALARYGGLGAIGRINQPSYRALHDELQQLGTMARLFPTIFLGVAAFLLNVVFKRLIGMQRDQIAILKAFGYNTHQVALHYGLIATLICLLGTLLGVGMGMWLGTHLTELYKEHFRLPVLHFSINLSVVFLGAGVSLLAALAGAGYSVYAAAGEPVAQAMRAPAPDRFRHTLAERIGIWRWLSQPTRIILRQLERKPGKALFSVVGLALAGGIVIMAAFQTSAITYMIDIEYRLSRHYDISATLIDIQPERALHELRALPGVHRVEGSRSVPVRLYSENRRKLTAIHGLPTDSTLHRLTNTRLQHVPLPANGLVLNGYLAEQLQVGVGDRIWVEVVEGRRQMLHLPITQLVHTYLGIDAYMDLDALNRTLGDGHVINNVVLTADSQSHATVRRELDRRPYVASSESRLAAIRSFFETIAKTSNIFTWIAVLMGTVVNFGVVYNSARIALAERARELASLRILGFTQGEVSYILLGEQALLVLLSIPLGFVAGNGLALFFANGMRSDFYRIPVALPPSAYAFSALVTILSAIVSGLAVYWRIRQLDLIGVLKTRE